MAESQEEFDCLASVSMSFLDGYLKQVIHFTLTVTTNTAPVLILVWGKYLPPTCIKHQILLGHNSISSDCTL